MKIGSNAAVPTAPLNQEASASSKKNQPNVGDLANKIAGNSMAEKSRRVEGHGNPKLDKDAFFKLMLAQVKNQDPLNPLKEHEMAAQLAQFSSLEQMSNVKDILTDMNKSQATQGQYQSLELMGQFITGDSSKIDRTKNDKQHEISFDLKDAADVVQVAIKDPNGETVKEFELKQQSQGPVKILWDGVDKDGKAQPPGTYRVVVAAASDLKGKVPVETQFKGQVTGVSFTEKGPMLSVGPRTVALKDVKTIQMRDEQQGQTVMQKSKRALSNAQPTALSVDPMKMASAPIDLAAIDTKNFNIHKK